MAKQLKAYIVRAYRMIGDAKFTVTEHEYRPDQHDTAKIAYKSIVEASTKLRKNEYTFDFVEFVFVYEDLLELYDARPK